MYLTTIITMTIITKKTICLIIIFQIQLNINWFVVFIIIKQIVFLIRLLSKVPGKGNTAEISVFYSGRHDTVINTPA